ncbi:MAG: bacteriocin transport accessory protein [Lachnospiraceae bacterium]|nr:bacteriocin transport accessory protein [Lachnospiraceae bacterium]
MKKRIVLLICGMMILSLFGCGKKEDVTETPAPEAATVDVADATELLTNVWGTYTEAELFPIGGGDYENVVMDAPGKYDVSKAEEMDSVLGLPQSSAAMIDDAASMMHMMNANTFTCGAYHLTDASKQQAFADALKENIMNRQWMCGFPDTLLIASVGDEYVVSAFGNAEIMETFKTKLTAQYEAAEVMYEESLVQ